MIAAFTDWDDLLIDDAVAYLRSLGWTVVQIGSTSPTVIIKRAREATALCVGYARVTADVVGALPNLKIIATASAGYDMVDVPAASARGVWVANLPAVATAEVASHTLALIMGLVREIPRLMGEVQAGSWTLTGTPLPRSCHELTLGVLGVGRIGAAVAQLAQPIFKQVIACDPQVADPPLGVALVDLAELLATSDVLSLHLPQLADDPPVLGERELRTLQPGAMIVNTSRGALVDEAALLAALDTGHISAAALDVLQQEPPALDHPLVGHPRVLLTPHAAFLSERTLRAYPLGQAENIVRWSQTGRPANPVVEIRT